MSTNNDAAQLATLIQKFNEPILQGWFEQLKSKAMTFDSGAGDATRKQCAQFLSLLGAAAQRGQLENIEGREWDDVRQLLAEVSANRARQGATPSETAIFVFSLKQALFPFLRSELEKQPEQLASATWSITGLLEQLGLYTVQVFQESRDRIIARQQQELLELSTPVVKLWQNILALPLIGTLDSARTQVVMENLLQKIIETGAAIAIIDITGVPTVDTLVAQHLLKTIAAARLMGADCIISGIRPQIAQTIVHLGVNLEDVITKATLADAFLIALERTGAKITVDNKG
ncbi:MULTISPECIES: STAS domain-containing protein [unclassified Herbaspirillum]|uniref:STAS domain-containing protein n=1 Tax=unclassified Herbaspirillum TaxID=2624150 RepID=UPI000E2E94F3|nr:MULTISPECIES: STAS domain-containing protein [unclassified Herbaspirillum]RFB73073.1 STAS domain-containing protein [Herbaspirillum sp. 3R-3a1]TFI11119.1 STAS domain-containing protein [Herbaspirillum sp. 3R11]TFI17027.1 STAS domain-containing protein [Herbaspirillum sp. 3R-11]TFI31105.1 STAS domain-containing protein [Herbaspirillum sp. 3C11]